MATSLKTGTRSHTHEEVFAATAEEMFTLLITPSAIRAWWGASRAIVIPEQGGTWAAAWGDEDAPEYITVARIAEFDPPRRIVFDQYRYHAQAGGLPFDAEFVTTFEVTPAADAGATLRVCQDGFPTTDEAQSFYEACETGWKTTFAGIRAYLEQRR